MSSYHKSNMKTFKAGADLSAKQYHFMKIGTNDDEVIIAGAGQNTIGVLMNAPVSGEPAEIAMPGGGALLKLDEAVSALDLLTATSSGQGEQVDAADEAVSAMAIEGGADGDVIEVAVSIPIANGASDA